MEKENAIGKEGGEKKECKRMDKKKKNCQREEGRRTEDEKAGRKRKNRKKENGRRKRGREREKGKGLTGLRFTKLLVTDLEHHEKVPVIVLDRQDLAVLPSPQHIVT